MAVPPQPFGESGTALPDDQRDAPVGEQRPRAHNDVRLKTFGVDVENEPRRLLAQAGERGIERTTRTYLERPRAAGASSMLRML